MSRPRILALLIPAFVAVPSLASADQGTGLEAVTDHAARQAAETIACTSPPARRYLRHALRDIDARRWGTVLTSLQGDTVDLVADAVYAAAARAPGGDPLRTFVGEPAATCGANEQTAARRALDEPEENAPPTEVDRCLARPFAQRRTDPACSFAAAVRGAMDGDVSAARTHVADVIASTTFDALYTGKSLSAQQVDALYEHVAYAFRQVMLARPNEQTIEDEVARAFGSVELDAVRGWRCADPGQASAAGDIHAAFCDATRPDYQAATLKAADRPVDLELAARTAKATTGADRDAKIAEALLCASGIECVGGKVDLTKGPNTKIDVGAKSFTLAKPGGLAASIELTSEIAKLRADLTVLVRDRLLGAEPAPETLRELSVAALRIRRVARTLDAAVQSSDREAYIIGPLEVLPTLLPHFSDAAAERGAPLARFTAGDLRAILLAAEDGHLRELASRVSTLVGPRDRTTCIAPSSAGLLDAFAANVPERRPHEDGWAGLEQIRGAAREVATCTMTSRAEPLVKFSLLPSPALRASWNSAYRNAWGSDGFRFVPSLDWISLRLRLTPSSAKVRAAMIVSVIDIVAPFNELAMRTPSLNYDRQEMIWLDAIRPRIDLSFSIPSISNHLSLVGGFALRTVAPYRGGGGKPNDTATYLAVGTPGGAAAEQFGSFIETSVGAKYSF